MFLGRGLLMALSDDSDTYTDHHEGASVHHSLARPSEEIEIPHGIDSGSEGHSRIRSRGHVEERIAYGARQIPILLRLSEGSTKW